MRRTVDPITSTQVEIVQTVFTEVIGDVAAAGISTHEDSDREGGVHSISKILPHRDGLVTQVCGTAL